MYQFYPLFAIFIVHFESVKINRNKNVSASES